MILPVMTRVATANNKNVLLTGVEAVPAVSHFKSEHHRWWHQIYLIKNDFFLRALSLNTVFTPKLS